MDILFQDLLGVSAFTSVAIVFFAVLSRFLGKRYGTTWRYFVWLIIAVRLMIPVHFTLPQPMVEIHVPQVAIQTAGEYVPFLGEDVTRGSIPIGKSGVEQNTVTQKTNIDRFTMFLQGVWERLWTIWLLGMFIYFACQGKKYHSFLKNLNRNSRCIRDAQVLEIYYNLSREMGMRKRPEIYFCSILPSPLCTGILKQKIYLNHEKYKKEQLSYILRHELVHCKRRDIWFKTVLMLVKGIHFFNPFVHWMVGLAQRDIEYSCDSLVLKECSLSQRQDYGLTILHSIREGQQRSSLSTAFHGGKEELKARIDHIFDMSKKKRGISLLLTLALVISVGTAFVGCTTHVEQAHTEQGTEDWIATIYQYKLDYIGNHLGVGNILGSLTLPKGLRPSEEGIELFTKTEPYGARRYLTLEQGAEIPENGWFEKDAMIFLALVENASFLEYSIEDEGGLKQILRFSREDGEKYFGNIDLRSMAVDESVFRNFIKELDALFSEGKDDTLKQIESNMLLEEIAHEMGDEFSYQALLQNEKYDQLLKLGDASLTAMLSNFEQGQRDDTKGYIMLAACLELLQVPVSVNDSLLKEMTPSQWYETYLTLDSLELEPFIYDEENYTKDLEKLGLLTMNKATEEGLVTRHSDVIEAVYQAMEQRFSLTRDGGELQIFAPLISHVSETEDKLSVYAVIGATRYSLIRIPNKGYQLMESGGSHTPGRLDFEKKDGNWVLVDWIDAQDGSYYAPSIKEMCKGTVGVANDIISYDSRELQMLLMQNLIFYLNDKTDITVYNVSHMEKKDIQEVSQYISFVGD